MKNPFKQLKKSGAVYYYNPAVHASGEFKDYFTTRRADTKAKIKKALKLRAIYNPKQVHGDAVFVLTKRNKSKTFRSRADAIITNLPDTPIAVRVADCVASVIVDPRKKAIAAVHSGWRGVANKIILKTVGKMRKKYGSKPGDLVVSMSPCIGPCCYEISRDLYGKLKKERDYSNIFRVIKGRPFMDLRKGNLNMLTRAGVKRRNISINDMCTMCWPGLFFSYRREKERAGRMYYIITLTSSKIQIPNSKKEHTEDRI